MNAHSREYKPALPDAIEAAEALLGAIFIDNAIYWRVAGIVQAEHFTEQAHRLIFGLVEKMMTESRPVNPLTLRPYLPDETIREVPFFQYVIRLQTEAVGTIAAEENALAVKEVWARRRLVSIGEGMADMARQPNIDMAPRKIIGEATGQLAALSRDIEDSASLVSMADALDQAIASINDAYKFKKPAGVATGIAEVDNLTGPWEPGQQIIFGGGTKQGKSALAMQCAVGLAASGPVLVYSGEMSLKQLAMREIARRTGIPVWRQKEGRISQQDFERLITARKDVAKLPIFIEKRRLTLEQIHQKGREIKMEHGLASMVIDHVGLLAWGRDLQRKDEWEQSQIATRELKAIYEDLCIPGVSLVQLKKNTFVTSDRGGFAQRLRDAINRRPKFTDLMGAVERDADHVIIPFNARPILAGLEPEEGSDDHLVWEDKMEEHKNKAEIILALSREQTFPQRRSVEWHGETTSFGAPFVGRQESLLGDQF